jgi:hypothetical protein
MAAPHAQHVAVKQGANTGFLARTKALTKRILSAIAGLQQLDTDTTGNDVDAGNIRHLADIRSNLLYQHSCQYNYDELPGIERIIVGVSDQDDSDNGGYL